MKGTLKRFFVPAFAAAVLVLAFFVRGQYVVPILTYHNVSVTEAQGSLNNVTPSSFEWQMKYLKDHRYNVIPFDQLIEGYKNKVSFPRNTVVIHFDDGYQDNYTNAYPVLKKYGLPAMVFLVSDKIGSPHYLTWEQVMEMDANGFKVGAHTRNHVYLPGVPLDVAKDEIAGSKRVIESRLGHSIDHLVYPSGGFTEDVKSIVRDAGYKSASTTNRGRIPLNKDLFELKRVRVKDTDRAFAMWAKSSGYYNISRKLKGGH